jgi:1,4-dihydroxy-6-naphthoate synthase
MKLAISTCPNDTFAFHAIIENKIDLQGLEFDIELLDIEQLNRGLMQGQFDIAKASYHAALLLADTTIVLSPGSALGFGVGPLLLSSEKSRSPDDNDLARSITLCPGELTTATLLFRIFYANALASGQTELKQVVFSEVMPQLQRRRAEFGVCIHEGRFTWEAQGLHLVEDLGTRWERATGQPLPLGGILAQRNLAKDQLRAVQNVIRNSIEYGLANRGEALKTMRRYAQEFLDDVLFQHVDLYVNDWTVALGAEGRKALQSLHQFAINNNAIPPMSRPIEVLD